MTTKTPQNFLFKIAFRDAQGAEDTMTSKVRLLPVGPMVYQGRKLDFTLADLQEIASETNRLIDNCKGYAAVPDGAPPRTPWTPPVIREHVPNGDTDGRVGSFEVIAGELFGVTNWREDTWAAILSERIEFVSVKVVGPYTDFKGVTYKRIVWEVSLTGQPVRKDIGRIQDTMTLADVPQNEDLKMTEEQIKEIMDALAALQATQAEIVARLAKLEGGDTKEPDAEAAAALAEETKAKTEEIAKLSESVAAIFLAQQSQAAAIVALSEKAPRMTNEPGNGGARPGGADTTMEARAAAAKAEGKSGLDSIRAQLGV